MNLRIAFVTAFLSFGLLACAAESDDPTATATAEAVDEQGSELVATAQHYWYRTWKTVEALCYPTPGDDSTTCGTLYAGRNYLLCQLQKQAHPYHVGNYWNDWYVYTDLDTPTGAKGWISAVYVTSGGNWEPIPGLPVCNF